MAATNLSGNASRYLKIMAWLLPQLNNLTIWRVQPVGKSACFRQTKDDMTEAFGIAIVDDVQQAPLHTAFFERIEYMSNGYWNGHCLPMSCFVADHLFTLLSQRMHVL